VAATAVASANFAFVFAVAAAAFAVATPTFAVSFFHISKRLGIKIFFNLVPIYYVPPSFDVVGAHVLIFEIICVFPEIQVK
jgi:hypothetical protein